MPTKQKPDAIAVLKEDHRKVEKLFEESYVEHDGAKVLIAELLDSAPDAEFYDAKVSVLSEMIKHHVKEEEKRSEGLFAQAKQAGVDLEDLGQRLMERKQALKEEFADGAEHFEIIEVLSAASAPSQAPEGERKGPIAEQWGGEVASDKHEILPARA